jgi:hypothetical protein
MWGKFLPLQILREQNANCRRIPYSMLPYNIFTATKETNQIVPAPQLRQHSRHELHIDPSGCRNKGRQQ